MSAKDAHYGGNLVDGAHMVHLFGDVATELLIMHDGDEGLFVAYDNVEFLAPVYAGDYIEAVGEIVKVGNTSRKMVFEARKVVAARPDISPSAADVLKEPVVVCRASGTCVVKKKRTSASLRAANGIFGPFRTRKRPAMRRPQAGAPERENGRCGRKFSANRSEQV